jgi:hypothetical protein
MDYQLDHDEAEQIQG